MNTLLHYFPNGTAFTQTNTTVQITRCWCCTILLDKLTKWQSTRNNTGDGRTSINWSEETIFSVFRADTSFITSSCSDSVTAVNTTSLYFQLLPSNTIFFLQTLPQHCQCNSTSSFLIAAIIEFWATSTSGQHIAASTLRYTFYSFSKQKKSTIPHVSFMYTKQTKSTHIQTDGKKKKASQPNPTQACMIFHERQIFVLFCYLFCWWSRSWTGPGNLPSSWKDISQTHEQAHSSPQPET